MVVTNVVFSICPVDIQEIKRVSGSSPAKIDTGGGSSMWVLGVFPPFAPAWSLLTLKSPKSLACDPGKKHERARPH